MPAFSCGGRPPAGTVKTVKAKVRTAHTRSSDKPKAIRNLTAIFKSIFAFLISKNFCYLMLSTKLNRRFQRMPEKPGWSGLWLHQMKIGLPTMWSSGTKPQ